MSLFVADVTDRGKALNIPGVYWRDDLKPRGYYINPEDASPHAIAMLRRTFPHLSDALPDTSPEQDASTPRPVDLATPWAGDRTAEDLLPNLPAEMRDRLYRYQQVDLAYLTARLREDGGAYCGWSRGLGKTFGAIAVAMELGVNKWIVVGPNSSKESVWRPELHKWAGNTFDVINLRGTKQQRERALTQFDKATSAVMLVHYEALRLVDWKRVNAELVVCDEAHRLAKGQAGGAAPAFYKALMKIKVPYRLALSGSVVVNTPEDLFGALHWLMPDRYSSKWRDFNSRFFIYQQGAWGQQFLCVKPKMLEPMKHEMGGLLVMRRKEDELPDLPTRIDQTIEVHLSPAQRKVYDDLATKFVAELPDGEMLLAPTVLAQLTKLRQVATGLDLMGEDFTDSAKLDLAEEMIADNVPNKTVVFAWHRRTVTALTDRLNGKGIKAYGITGDTKDRARAEYVKEFQEDPDVKVIVATIKTLGEAVTLHAASDLIFVESSWTPTDMEQAADRVYRIGQKNHVTITTIVAADTVDVYRVLPVLKSKSEIRALVLGGTL